MDLEQRVKMLEQEVLILKNQIQASLLDIQELLLVQHHPSLRATGIANPDSRRPSATPSQEEFLPSAYDEQPAAMYHNGQQEEDTLILSRPSAEGPRKTVSLDTPSVQTQDRVVVKDVLHDVFPVADANDPDVYQTDDPIPDLQAPVSQVLSQHPLSEPPVIRTHTHLEADWEAFTSYTDWAMDNLAKLGPERACVLIEIYEKAGYFTPQVKDALVLLIQRFSEPVRSTDWITETVDALIANPGPVVGTSPAPDIEWMDAVQIHEDRRKKRALVMRMIDGLKALDAERSSHHG